MMGKLGKTPKAEHQQTPRKNAWKMAREINQCQKKSDIDKQQDRVVEEEDIMLNCYTSYNHP
jgi:hypothetical protein